MTARAITQIAAAPGGGGKRDVLFALADDGSLWRLALKQNNPYWLQVVPLPDTDVVPAGPPYPGAL